MSRPPRVRVHGPAAQRIRSGYLWVHRRDIRSIDGSYDNGDPADVTSPEGKLLGRGVINDRSHLVVRLWTRKEEAVDAHLLCQRLDRALELRRQLGASLELGRLVNGEGDLAPGLILDRYGSIVVVQIGSLGVDRWRTDIAAWIRNRLGEVRIYERGDTRARRREGLEPRTGFWEPDSGETEVEVARPDGLKMFYDVAEGQKTGGYLDQIGNQQHIGPLLEGRSILDAFCADGGFGLSALAHGASRVLFLDISEPNLQRARRNLALNELESRAALLRANAFDCLRGFEVRGARFGAVVLDPPSFTKSRSQLDDAYRGYKEINLRALKLLEPGGFLFSCSCSYHVTREMFREMLNAAAHDAHRSVRIIEERSAGPDHPESLGAPEGRYLKAILAWVD